MENSGITGLGWKVGAVFAIAVALVWAGSRTRTSDPGTAPAEVAMAAEDPPGGDRAGREASADESPWGARKASEPVASPGQPWWAALGAEEVAARRADFDAMYDQPDVFPEFSEIVRQLGDAGVPIEIVRMEAREIFGALLQRRHHTQSAGELRLMVSPDDSDAARESNALVVAELLRKAAEAEAEVKARLTNHGVALDSTPGVRILRLSPHTPLRSLSGTVEAGVKIGSAVELEGP